MQDLPGPDLGWRDDALCAEVGIDLFFPEKGEPTKDAKAVCQLCPVRSECLQYALQNDERFGIWGGMSEQERHQIQPLRRARRTDLADNLCRRGLHIMEGANLAVNRNGSRRCVACKRVQEVDRNARRRAARSGAQAA